MRIPNPYFKKIPCIGDLVMDYIIYEYDYPLLFICKNSNNLLYLCDCCDTYKEQRWVIAPVTLEKLKKLFAAEVGVREVFENADGQCCVATWSMGDLHEKYRLIGAKDFSPDDLPEEDAYIEAEDEEHQEYIERIKFRIEYQMQEKIGKKLKLQDEKDCGSVDFRNLIFQYTNDEAVQNILMPGEIKGTTDSDLTMGKIEKSAYRLEDAGYIQSDLNSIIAA